jgi:hypothetical protein
MLEFATKKFSKIISPKLPVKIIHMDPDKNQYQNHWGKSQYQNQSQK